MSKQTTWVDLSGIGLYLSVYRDANKQPGLTIIDTRGVHAEEIRRLGFKQGSGAFSEGVYVRANMNLTMAMMVKAFGAENVKVIQLSVADIRSRFDERLRQHTAKNANSIFAQERPIGLNHLGELVRQSVIGRYVKFEVDGQVRLVQEDANDPARFMYVTDEVQLHLVARGFVSRITERSEFLRREHIDRLMNVSNVAGLSERQYQEAIETQLGELFSRKSAAVLDSGGQLLSLFDLANTIYVGAPDLRARTSNSMANQQFSTPLPLALAAQALLGRREELVGKTTLEPTIGNGATVRALKAVGAKVFGVEIDTARVENVQSLVDSVICADAAQTDFADAFGQADGFDFVVANPPFQAITKISVPLPQGGAVSEVDVARLDYLIALKALAARKPEGRAVFILGGDNVFGDGHIKPRSQHFYNYLYDHYEVNGAVEISGELYKKQGAEFPVRLVVVGERRLVPITAAAPTILPIIRTYEGLRDWTASVLDATMGAHGEIDQLMENSLAEVLAHELLPEHVAEDVRVENEFQQKYVAFSNVGEPSTMIPANLSGPVYEALAGIKGEHGDIDAYVSRKLQFEVSELADLFLPEQVDAIAMVLHAQFRGLGFLLADQPGVGKGRVLAGIARHERLEGRIPMFVTLTDNLFSDFLERDVAQINSRGLFKRPFIVNDGARTVNGAGEVVAKSVGRKKYTALAESATLPDGTDIVMLTYSQLARSAETNITARFMRAVAEKYPIALLLDESHAGAGSSNTSENLEAMVMAARSVLYSSGTPIKGAKNLRLYRKILPSAVDAEEILQVVESDPLSMQEALNYEIAAQGCLIARERETTGITKEYIQPRDLKRNQVIADQMSEILSAMSFIAGDVKKIVGQMEASFASILENVPENERAGSRMQASAMNFGSRLHQLTRQMLLALKAPDVVAEVMRTLGDNKKPIVALQHTGESLLRDFIDAQELVGASETDEGGRQTMLPRAVTFKDLLHRYVERILRIKVIDRYGKESFKIADSIAISEAKGRLSALISVLPDDLPLTPIDFVRQKLAEAGFSMGEISGRSLRATTLPDGRMLVEPMPEFGDRTRVNRTIRAFNNGDIDLLVLTASGSTGLSVQASPSVGTDVRVRRMIKWEMQANITDERQIDGRHNRTGQIASPEYAIPLSGLVADDRLAMQFNNKNRSLTSSTVANRDSRDLIRDVPDLLNAVGDEVAMQLLHEKPDLARKLDIEIGEDEFLHARSHRSLSYIGKLTGRISLLKVSEQQDLYQEMQGRFIELLDRFKAEGRNPLEVDCHEWKAKVLSREVFMGEASASAGSGRSQLGTPVYLTELEYQVMQKAVRSAAIDAMTARAPAVASETELIVSFLVAQRGEILAQHLGKKFKTVNDALAAKDPNEVKSTAAKLDWLVANLPRLKAGATFVERDLEGLQVPKVVVSVIVPSDTQGFMRLSEYAMSVMEPGSDVSSWRSLSPIFAGGLELGAVAFIEDGAVREAFDSAKDGQISKHVRVLDGNLFDATSMNLRAKIGQKIVYTDETGARQHGILIYSGVTRSDLQKIPERVSDLELMRDFVVAGGVLTTIPPTGKADAGKCVRVSGDRNRGYRLVVPAVKYLGGDIYLDPAVAVISGKESENKLGLNFAQSGNTMVALLREADLGAVLSYLTGRKGQKLFVEDRRMLAKVRSQRSALLPEAAAQVMRA